MIRPLLFSLLLLTFSPSSNEAQSFSGDLTRIAALREVQLGSPQLRSPLLPDSAPGGGFVSRLLFNDSGHCPEFCTENTVLGLGRTEQTQEIDLELPVWSPSEIDLGTPAPAIRSLSSRHPDTKSNRYRVDTDRLTDLAILLANHGKLAEAIPLFRRVVGLDPESWPPHNNLARAFLQVSLG